MQESNTSPWYQDITKPQWHALFAAQSGWMLDAMDFVIYLMAIPKLQAEFGFGAATAGLLATATLLSSAVGGIFFGALADSIGRRRSLNLSIFIFSVCSLGSATSHNFVQLMAWRTVLGFGMGGEWSAGAALVSETWPSAHRGKAIGIVQSGWALGYILAAVLAGAILPAFGWRVLFAVGFLPALFTLWIRKFVAEPELWAQKSKSTKVSPLAGFTAIFKQPLGSTTLRATLISTAVMFGYWGLFSWMPSFLASPIEKGGAGLSLVKSTAWLIPMQLGAFFGYLSFGFISDRFGRKPTFAGYLILAAIIVPIYGHLARTPEILMILGPILGFVGHGYFSLFGSMLAELFPTSSRALGQGFSYNAGRAMSSLAPLTVGALSETYGIGSALGVTSGFFVVGALLITLLPETAGQDLG